MPGSRITYAENFGAVGHPFIQRGDNEFRAYFVIDQKDANLFLPFTSNYDTEGHLPVCVSLHKQFLVIQ